MKEFKEVEETHDDCTECQCQHELMEKYNNMQINLYMEYNSKKIPYTTVQKWLDSLPSDKKIRIEKYNRSNKERTESYIFNMVQDELKEIRMTLMHQTPYPNN